ncbi:hypothetical protein N7466_005684 [Penicillium verhagenii]|uniref:uncharacterized protein n=1 Tax=Penicillium verhagenii TaxID=1562060 RepID=UPI0025458318|nr:uncharacterized protein N7466_005684 [Penicillium verhagenii]KAJ5930191.1 hypothetical protein N7466_005684 [Penicillium verhagenii]
MENKDEVEAENLIAHDGLADRNESPTGEKTPTQATVPTYKFKKWVDSFRARKYANPYVSERLVEGWPNDSRIETAKQRRERLLELDLEWGISSGNWSQQECNTPTMSLTSESIARSRATTQSTITQSELSVRHSGDSSRPKFSPYADEQSKIRANKRRLALQELTGTEEDYVLGLKALTGVLSLFDVRMQIQHNIQQICEIHDHFQGRLQEVSPLSSRQTPEEASDILSRASSKRSSGFRGLKTLQTGSLRTRKFKARINQDCRSLFADPAEVLEVAREIERLVKTSSFSAYEKFCSNYEILSEDVAILRRSIPNWSIYDQGIEALSKSVVSMNSLRHEENRSMSMADLMVKPIQRLCKYPLLLNDLLRETPVGDCPTSHEGIQHILDNIRGLVQQINAATGNPVNQDRIKKTLALQKRIQFSDSYVLQDIYKDLGPMTLCGVLYVTYQTPELITGDFMVCVLFRSYFLIAKSIDDSNRLELVACIYVRESCSTVIPTGQGIYYYDCPFTWKILFSDQDGNFELVLSASSATEEKQWRTEMLKCPVPPEARNPHKYSLLTLVLVPLDKASYGAGSLSRRSMDAVSISRRSTSQHVVIRKTRCPRSYDESTNTSSEIDRPKSSLARTPWVVTARRVDRIRLEKLISEYYTRDVLPWPGMILGRGDMLFGRGSIMRHLSLHKGFARRSTSISSTHSGPVVTETQAIDDYNGEEKELITSQDGCGDQYSPMTDCESPKTPTSILGRSRTVRFGPNTGKKSLTLPRGENRPSQESNLETTPPRKKWSSPMTLLSVLSPKNLIRSRAETGTEG